MATVSEAIKAIRERLHLTQSEMAGLLGIDRQQYYYFEKRGDKLTVEQVKKIAAALGVQPIEIFTYGEPPVTDEQIQLVRRDLSHISTRLEISENELSRLRRGIRTAIYGVTKDLIQEAVKAQKIVVVQSKESLMREFYLLATSDNIFSRTVSWLFHIVSRDKVLCMAIQQFFTELWLKKLVTKEFIETLGEVQLNGAVRISDELIEEMFVTGYRVYDFDRNEFEPVYVMLS